MAVKHLLLSGPLAWGCNWRPVTSHLVNAFVLVQPGRIPITFNEFFQGTLGMICEDLGICLQLATEASLAASQESGSDSLWKIQGLLRQWLELANQHITSRHAYADGCLSQTYFYLS